MTQSFNASSELLDRLPPHNLEAERGVLGSIILDPRLIDDVTPILRSDEFYVDAHAKLYRALGRLHDAGKRIDTALLAEALKVAGEFEAIGGAAYLAEIVHAVPTAAHAVYYAQIVSEQATRRQLILLALDAVRNAYDPTCELQTTVGAMEAGLMRSQVGGAADKPRLFMDVVRDVVIEAELALERGYGGGVMTGLLKFDRAHGGLWPGELVVLGARPSQGKTALAMQVAVWVARGGLVYVASLEMRATELAMRQVCGEAGLSSSCVRTGTLSSEDLASLADASNVVAGTSFVIHDRPGLSVSDVRSQARRLRPKGLRMVVVDYLQLLRPNDVRTSRVQQVTEMSKGLKELARELDVPVLAVSQLSRQGAEDRPQLWHLRDSGSIEQDADVVLLLYRPKGGMSDKQQPGSGRWDAELDVAKARNGPVMTLRLNWDATRLRFDPPDIGHSEFNQFS